MTDDDVQGGLDRFRPGLFEFVSKLSKLNGGVANFLSRDDVSKTKGTEIETAKEKAIIVPVVEANETFL
jgi:hypothetical protein